MKRNWQAIFSAFVAASVVNLGGVLLFFDPIAKSDSADGPIVAPAIGFFVYVILSVALFDWTARQVRSAYKAAFIVGASQFILVNVDYVLAGKRGIMTGAASTVLMIATWICVALAYSYFASWDEKA